MLHLLAVIYRIFMHELQTWKIHMQGLGEPGGGYPRFVFF